MSVTVAHSYVEANGLRFRVARVENSGRFVILLHGFPECWYSWRHQLPAMGGLGYRAWAPDLRGYNLSDKPLGRRRYRLTTLAADVHELIRAAGEEKAVVVGHDWGAVIAWRFAMEYPAETSRLVIMNVPHPARYRWMTTHLRQIVRSSYVGFFQIPWLPEYLMQHNPRWFAESIRASAVVREAFSDEDIEVYARAIAQPGAMHAAIDYYREFVREGSRLPIKRIEAPALMIWGEHDTALDRRSSYVPAEWVPNLRTEYIDCGHWVQNEAAARVNALLAEFLG